MKSTVVLTLPDAGSCGQVPRGTSAARVCSDGDEPGDDLDGFGCVAAVGPAIGGEYCPGARSAGSARLPSGLAGRSTYGTTTSTKQWRVRCCTRPAGTRRTERGILPNPRQAQGPFSGRPKGISGSLRAGGWPRIDDRRSTGVRVGSMWTPPSGQARIQNRVGGSWPGTVVCPAS